MGNEEDAEEVTAHHDYLMLACKLDDVAWLDIRPDEKAIFENIHNYELTTTLVSIPANDQNAIPTTPHMFLAGKLVSSQDLNRWVYAFNAMFVKVVVAGLCNGPCFQLPRLLCCLDKCSCHKVQFH